MAVFTGADLAGDWAGPMPCAWPVVDDMKSPAHFPLTADKARYVGDAVAVVVAESSVAAKDAAEAVVVDYDVLPAVVDLEDSLSDRVVINDDLGTNLAYTWELKPDEAKVDAAFAAATHVVKERYIQQRLIPSPMEPRGVLSSPPRSAATTPSTPPRRSPTSSRSCWRSASGSPRRSSA